MGILTKKIKAQDITIQKKPGKLFLSLKNKSSNPVTATIFDALDSSNKAITRYEWNTALITDYNGYSYSIVINGVTYSGSFSIATTATQFAAVLTALGFGTFAVNTTTYNTFYVNDNTNVYGNFTITAIWLPQTSNTTKYLQSIHFIDANNGWCCGQTGTILNTPNSGTTWTAQISGTTSYLRSIFFIDANNGWCGTSLEILRTTNGGTTWTSQASIYSILSIYFTDINNGWCCGMFGTILHTTNGGTTWTPQTSGTVEILESIFFLDANNGWCCGQTGTILHTTNGGTTWTPQTSGTANNLQSIHFIDANNGWCCGQTGTILKYVNTSSIYTVITYSSLSGTSIEIYTPIGYNSLLQSVSGEPFVIKKFTITTNNVLQTNEKYILSYGDVINPNNKETKIKLYDPGKKNGTGLVITGIKLREKGYPIQGVNKIEYIVLGNATAEFIFNIEELPNLSRYTDVTNYDDTSLMVKSDETEELPKPIVPLKETLNNKGNETKIIGTPLKNTVAENGNILGFEKRKFCRCSLLLIIIIIIVTYLVTKKQ